MKTKIIKTPGLSQEDVDAEFAARLDEREAKLTQRESDIQSEISARIEAGKSKAPRFSADKLKVERAQRPDDLQSGLRL